MRACKKRERERERENNSIADVSERLLLLQRPICFFARHGALYSEFFASDSFAEEEEAVELVWKIFRSAENCF